MRNDFADRWLARADSHVNEQCSPRSGPAHDPHRRRRRPRAHCCDSQSLTGLGVERERRILKPADGSYRGKRVRADGAEQARGCAEVEHH
jgi:hypothetical protein